MKTRTVYEWFQGKNGRGYWHARRCGRIVADGGGSYSRVRDAKRAAVRQAKREGGIVRRRA